MQSNFDNQQANPGPAPVVISVQSSMALNNFVTPATQEEYDAVVSILQATLHQTLESFLADGQALSDLTITSIGGQAGVIRRRFLESAEVDYVMTLEESCTGNCDSSSAAASLYNQVTTQLADNVESGSFASTLKSNAEADEKAASLANVAVLAPTFAQYSIQTPTPTENPTQSPVTASPTTMKPTSVPTAQQTQLLPAPGDSSGGRLSGHVVFTMFSAIVLYFFI